MKLRLLGLFCVIQAAVGGVYDGDLSQRRPCKGKLVRRSVKMDFDSDGNTLEDEQTVATLYGGIKVFAKRSEKSVLKSSGNDAASASIPQGKALIINEGGTKFLPNRYGE